LRAFSNVCRHRAGPIALGSGCKNVLRCQYHGWTYTLDGRPTSKASSSLTAAQWAWCPFAAKPGNSSSS
jgi:phenylpropionate dioxygenase-like ring-hydroxylating dioxygenase large terminal subunit